MQYNVLMNITIVRSSYYEALLTKMEQSAKSELMSCGIPKDNIKTITVPGAFEIPLACKKTIESEKIDGIIAIGIIIQGETHHAVEVARACTDGLMQVQIETGVPITHEVLYVDSREQAEARMARGAEAAQTLLKILKSN